MRVSSLSDTADARDAALVSSRLSWVMWLRVLIISALLGTTIFLNRDSGAIGSASTQFLFGLIVVTYVLTIAYAVWFRVYRRLEPLAYVQFFVDTIMFSAILYATGGVSSGFSFLYHLWVIVAAVAMGKRFAYFQATASSGAVITVTVLLSMSLLDPLSDLHVVRQSADEIAYYLLINIASLYLVAALVNVLLARLKVASEQLEEVVSSKAVLEVQLAQAERLAALGELAATLAHEIRNPLSAVSGSFQMMRDEGMLREADAPLFDIVNRELSRMERLVDDILEYARPSKMRAHDVDLNRLVGELVVLFQNGKYGLDVTFEPEEDLTCRLDALLIKQVLWNLLVNAAQACGEGGRIVVTVGRKTPDCCYIAVRDSGPGVKQEVANRIFDAFFSTKERGMGLGLALCKRIVDAHGGRLKFKNGDTEGAVFEVVLPLAAAVPSQESSPTCDNA